MFPGAVHLSFFFRATFKEYVHCLYVVPISHGMLLGVDVMVETRVENVAAIMTIVNFLKVTMIFFCLGLQKAQKKCWVVFTWISPNCFINCGVYND